MLLDLLPPETSAPSGGATLGEVAGALKRQDSQVVAFLLQLLKRTDIFAVPVVVSACLLNVVLLAFPPVGLAGPAGPTLSGFVLILGLTAAPVWLPGQLSHPTLSTLKTIPDAVPIVLVRPEPDPRGFFDLILAILRHVAAFSLVSNPLAAIGLEALWFLAKVQCT